MCGFVGFLCRGGFVEAGTTLSLMASKLEHRGPDDGGKWVDDKSEVGLAHRRLSIVDLSPAGAQPMQSASGRWVIAFNGEIYNHLELRSQLMGVAWRGHSDTETLLAAIENWGVPATLGKLVGMFAFALWDRVEKTLTLARDRAGEKPLYYGWVGNSFLFGSELKALTAHADWRGEIDRDALALFMRYGYVPLPHSIWRGVQKLLPGTHLTISIDMRAGSTATPVSYWRGYEVASRGTRSCLTDDAATSELGSHLLRSIAGQMVADVPLGAFLSGGVDSSVVVALMQAQSGKPVKTFSIGFNENDYDEAIHARAVARHLGTDHTEFYLSPSDALAVIPRLPEMFDEPFGDSSQIPTHLVAQIARQHVTVCLSGDGGDELFGGYNRYFWGRAIWKRVGWLPQTTRYAAGRLISSVPPETWDRIGRLLPKSVRQPALGDRLHKLAGVIDVANPDELYRRLVSQHREHETIVLGGREKSSWADQEATAFGASGRDPDFVERMMFHDLVGYMADDILTKVDRAAMGCSLETRVPMLDHRVIEFAWSLPLHMKIRDGEGKWLLRQLLYRYVPRELIERPKQGFGVPLDSWLRGPLRQWAEELIDESRLVNDGYLNGREVRLRWVEHLSGRRNWQHWLWNVLMFQAWLDKQRAASSVAS